jgi:cysteinyl-tRNA synthetase
MSKLVLYNTLSRKKEIFKPAKGKTVNLYTCGPTVYDCAHIGNLRSYIFADVLRRVLELNGYKVNWAMNITDVDDKTIKRAVNEYGAKAGVKELKKYTGKYLKAFKEDLKKLNIPTGPKYIKLIRVSEKMDEIKKFVKNLIKLGYAYKTDDGVYFDIVKYQKKFGDYGALVGKEFLKGKKIGARVKVDDYEKKNLSDFALWKKRDKSDGNIFWKDSELGEGRPGWHIECSAINRFAFGGKPTDIHTGGIDLAFPHHTNEIAQSQPVYKPFVNFWSHCEHLMADGKKMAKREKNFHTLNDLEKEFSNAGETFRYLALQTNYRTQMNFTADSLKAAETALDKLTDNPQPATDNKKNKEFIDSLNDDLNTAKALSVLQKSPSKKMADALGIRLKKTKISEIPAKILKLAEKRDQLRANEQFIKADALRKQIEGLGYKIEDGKHKSKITPSRH